MCPLLLEPGGYPACREPLDSKARPARILYEQISKLEVMCYNAAGVVETASAPAKKKQKKVVSSIPVERCSWKGRLGDLEQHVRVCGFAVVACAFEGCGVSVEREC